MFDKHHCWANLRRYLPSKNICGLFILNLTTFRRFPSGMQEKFDGAESFYKRSVAIHQQLLGRDHPDVAESLNNLGAFLKSQV
jgi:hypothetical protein